jgi:hypothetical protein
LLGSSSTSRSPPVSWLPTPNRATSAATSRSLIKGPHEETKNHGEYKHPTRPGQFLTSSGDIAKGYSKSRSTREVKREDRRGRLSKAGVPRRRGPRAASRSAGRSASPGRTARAPPQASPQSSRCFSLHPPLGTSHKVRLDCACRLIDLAGARTPRRGVEKSIESLRFVTRPSSRVIPPGSRAVGRDPRRFSRREAHRRIFIQSVGPAGRLLPRSRHCASFRGRRRLPRSGATVAKALIRRSKAERKQTSHTEGATMIAATAFAVVGLVVVAFLNRIP